MTCRLIRGKTPIPEGKAIAQNDLTIANEFLAVSFPVDTTPPWGLPPGGILDGALVINGVIQTNRLTSMDFIPDNWAGRPNSRARLTVDRDTPEKIVVNSVRDWGKVWLESKWSLEAGKDFIHVLTIMTNRGDEPLPDLLSGYSLCPSGGFYFLPVPEKEKGKEKPRDWAASYTQTDCIGLHTPFCDTVFEKNRLDMFLEHTLEPGDSIDFEAWMQFCPDPGISVLSDAEIRRKKIPAGKLTGYIREESQNLITHPYVIAFRNDQPYTWTMGKDGFFELTLPEGEWELKPFAKNFCPGKSVTATVLEKENRRIKFFPLTPSVPLRFYVRNKQNDSLLDSRIRVKKKEKPVIGFLEKQIVFTGIDTPGIADISVSLGMNEFEITSGDDFFSQPVTVKKQIEKNDGYPVDVAIDMEEQPAGRNWFCADLHHHSDILDGATAPLDVISSQLASGLDLIFISDHDSYDNVKKIFALTKKRGLPFIPALEISANWGHFNIFPLSLENPDSVSHENKTAKEIFRECRNIAEVTAVNHPFSSYGYFYSLGKKNAPGGFDGNFDLLELNSRSGEIEETIQKAWEFWNEKRPYYLTAGTDNHDVFREQSGFIRMFVYIDGLLNGQNFIRALKNGHGYASMGPVIYPEPIFGSTVPLQDGESQTLVFETFSVNGLKNIQLINEGQIAESVDLSESGKRKTVTFAIKPEKDTWYSVVVEDSLGKKAFGNPIWIKNEKRKDETDVGQ